MGLIHFSFSIRFRLLRLMAAGMVFLPVLPTFALTPMEYYNSLVAGGDDAGFQDGEFYRARFSHPSGLCLDGRGGRLFVADRDNHRIRVVYLERDHRVETLAGTGTAGREDGPVSKATFNQPAALAFIPPDQLAVFDAGDNLLRVVDLRAGKVWTVPLGPLGGVWNLVYVPGEGSLYFSEPAEGLLQRLDWKTQQVTTVLSRNPQLPHPQALCLHQDRLYAADRDLPSVFRIDGVAWSPPGKAAVKWVEVGKGDHIQELAGSVSFLYALQAGPVPLARVLPDSRAVSLATPWGFPVDNQNPGAEPLLKFGGGVPVGFAASPNEERKFFISCPGAGLQDIISVQDYDFDKWWKSYSRYENNAPLTYITDFEYPEAKPFRTFRILLVGESRVLTAPSIDPDAKPSSFNEYQWTVDTLRTHTFPKQLELLLNTEGVLRNAETHFQVLVVSAHGQGPGSYLNEEIPAFVKRYDIDLVLVLAGKSSYEDYFEKPLNREGIPIIQVDPAFLIKPLSDRIPAGVPARFYANCRQKGLLKDGAGFPFWWEILDKGDGEIRRDLMEMTAKPLRLFADKLKAMRTSTGATPRLGFFYLPWRDWGPQDKCEAFWDDLCRENHLGMLDLSDPFNALKTSYYPINQPNCMRHYTAEGGNVLIARLLGYYLTEQGWVP